MKGRFSFGSENAEVDAEVESDPLPPIPDEFFFEVCKLARLLVVAAAGVGIVYLAGNAGLLFDGVAILLYGLYRLMVEDV